MKTVSWPNSGFVRITLTTHNAPGFELPRFTCDPEVASRYRFH